MSESVICLLNYLFVLFACLFLFVLFVYVYVFVCVRGHPYLPAAYGASDLTIHADVTANRADVIKYAA